MKTTNKTIVAIALIVGFLASCLFAEVQIVQHGGASLPREATPQGQSWSVASTNWMQLLRTGGNSLGTGRTMVVREHDLGDYKKMLTSSTLRTWKGLDDSLGSTIEYGNFWHEAFQVKCTNGETFVPSAITATVQSFTNGVGGSITTTTFSTLNSFRQVLNSDNTIASEQNASKEVSNFLYGGIGKALTIGGTGTTQERIDATSNYWWSQDYFLHYTVTVPYKDSQGNSHTTISSWDVKRIMPEMIMSGGDKLTVSNMAIGKQYSIETSSTLAGDWVDWRAFLGQSESLEYSITEHRSENLKMFYRIKY